MKNLFKKKKKGFSGLEIILVMFFLMLVVTMCFVAEKYNITSKSQVTKDNLDISNLAAYKNIDQKALGDTPPIFRITDLQGAFTTFKDYLIKNMSLDSDMNGLDNSVAVGKVTIDRFIIYNVTGTQVEICDLDTTTNIFVKTVVNDMNVTPVKTPTGVLVKKTSIHSEISLNIDIIFKALLGSTLPASVYRDTDITF